MIRIRFFSSFCDSKIIPEKYERVHQLKEQSKSSYEKDYIFTNDDDFTHAILLNTPMPPELSKKIPKENVIGLAFEPPQFLGLTQVFINYAKETIGKYFIGYSTDIRLPKPFTERFGCMWNAIPPKLEEIPSPKPKCMSIMISNKISAPGHRYRHQLVQEILKTDLPIDIYGRGCQYYRTITDSRFKGEFTEIEPYLDYEYHIAIENFKTPHYFSEKIINPLVCHTTPIYWGCSAIEEYFNQDTQAVILLKGNLLEDIALLRKLCDKYSHNEYSIKLEQSKVFQVISIDTLIQKEWILPLKREP
jgi:hypothetical protein